MFSLRGRRFLSCLAINGNNKIGYFTGYDREHLSSE